MSYNIFPSLMLILAFHVPLYYPKYCQSHPFKLVQLTVFLDATLPILDVVWTTTLPTHYYQFKDHAAHPVTCLCFFVFLILQ